MIQKIKISGKSVGDIFKLPCTHSIMKNAEYGGFVAYIQQYDEYGVRRGIEIAFIGDVICNDGIAWWVVKNE